MVDYQTNTSDKQKAIRLIEFLTRVVLLRSKVIHDYEEYDKVLWISSIPQDRDCFTQAWGQNEEHEPDEWLIVQNRREPEVPDIPEPCKYWTNIEALKNKQDLPSLLPEISQEVPNPNWRTNSEQPKTISIQKRLKDHPEIQQVWDCYVEKNGCLGWKNMIHGREFTRFTPIFMPSFRNKYDLVKNTNWY
jgi:hypothetical protein